MVEPGDNSRAVIERADREMYRVETRQARLDREQFRYRSFLSDIAGQDIRAHRADPSQAIERVATWLRERSNDPNVPGGRAIVAEYARFAAALPRIAASKQLQMDELTFNDFWSAAAEWITAEFPPA